MTYSCKLLIDVIRNPFQIELQQLIIALPQIDFIVFIFCAKVASCSTRKPFISVALQLSCTLIFKFFFSLPRSAIILQCFIYHYVVCVLCEMSINSQLCFKEKKNLTTPISATVCSSSYSTIRLEKI